MSDEGKFLGVDGMPGARVFAVAPIERRYIGYRPREVGVGDTIAADETIIIQWPPRSDGCSFSVSVGGVII